MRLRFLSTLSMFAVLAACGSPAEESDDPVAQDSVSPSSEILTAEPDENGTELADSGVEDTGDTEEEAASPTPSPSPTPSASARPARPSPSPTPSATRVAAAATAPPIFAVCGACHAVEAGDHGIGPSLAGVFNAKAASKSGFDYSDAMENSGLTWNQATLDRYLEDPKGVVPGTSMAYNGLKNAQQRQAVIAYLRGL